MIDKTDSELVEWLTPVVAPAPVQLGPPPSDPDGSGLACYLFEVVPDPPARGVRRAPIQATARYLVTTWAPQPAEAHRTLGAVLVAASDRADVEVDRTAPPLALWHGLGVAPQPALVLLVPLRWLRPEPDVHRVLEPLHVQFQDIGVVFGRVVTPSGTPLARAEVRIPPLDVPVWTGPDGSFRIPGAPRGTGAWDVVVTARGRTQVVTVPAPPNADTPLTVVFEINGGVTA